MSYYLDICVLLELRSLPNRLTGLVILSKSSLPFSADIFARIREGDRRAFEALAEVYYEPLVKQAYRYTGDQGTAEDIVQDVLFNMWMGRSGINVRSNAASYLFGAIPNRAFNHFRNRRTEARTYQTFFADNSINSNGQDLFPAWSDPEEHDEFLQRLAQVRHLLETLPPRQAEAIQLRIHAGLSFAEIAEVMGLTLRSAQTTYHKGVIYLRSRLSELES